jgi:hypothetical protein
MLPLPIRLFSINAWADIAGDCLVDPHVLPHRLTGNHYRDFLSYDLPKLLEDVDWQSEHECGTCMMVLRHILAVLCEMFSITPIMIEEGRFLSFIIFNNHVCYNGR